VRINAGAREHVGVLRAVRVHSQFGVMQLYRKLLVMAQVVALAA
jgi:hypothetical protein